MRSDSGSRRDFARIVHDDSYRLRAFPAGFFTHVVDVGANIGAFSMLARCLNPRAQIHALEPDAGTFQMLRENAELFRVDALQVAMGDGRPVATHAGSRPFVVVCSRVARDEIVASLERGRFGRGCDCAILPDEDPQPALS